MKADIKSKAKIATDKFKKNDEKETLVLYEALGKEICRRFEFTYLDLLEIMLKREKEKKAN